ncbi:hypothetical protein E2562_003361 [Oryza meyeriana var. granulata]|uniref:Amino acid transporter transmembrane domain-containing protein n=1 Tax=Oryza meyeriana var. granulata TaxID=110450 RepID=A0A6G1EFE4_9ORYZ|nr:hypothetical protein E2562_003361 [Oryza meyeriana var. granulata]
MLTMSSEAHPNGGFRGSLIGVGVVAGFSSVQKDMIKQAPRPSEATVMKRATVMSVIVITLLYVLCGCMGYATFGDDASGNLLTGFGFYEPFWLLDIANAALVFQLIGAYVPAYVGASTIVAMLLPFFGNVVMLLAAMSFWPLTVYFPVEMYIA